MKTGRQGNTNKITAELSKDNLRTCKHGHTNNRTANICKENLNWQTRVTPIIELQNTAKTIEKLADKSITKLSKTI